MNAVRPYTFALIVVCVVAASTVFQLQQLLKSSCASHSTALTTAEPHTDPSTHLQSSSHFCASFSVDSFGVPKQTSSDLRLGVLLRPHDFKLSHSLLKQTDRIVQHAVCSSQSLMGSKDICLQRLTVEYFVSTNRRFYAHERVHKLPTSHRSDNDQLSADWLRQHRKFFDHMDAILFEGALHTPNKNREEGLSQISLNAPNSSDAASSYLFTNSSVFIMTLHPTQKDTRCPKEELGKLLSPETSRRTPHSNQTNSLSEPPTAQRDVHRTSDSWFDVIMSVLDDLVFGFDVESAETLGYGEESPAHSLESDAKAHAATEPDRDFSVPDMSGDQFQWLLRVVVMVAWLHMFWDQL